MSIYHKKNRNHHLAHSVPLFPVLITYWFLPGQNGCRRWELNMEGMKKEGLGGCN